jgi:hypothetical protein
MLYHSRITQSPPRQIRWLPFRPPCLRLMFTSAQDAPREQVLFRDQAGDCSIYDFGTGHGQQSMTSDVGSDRLLVDRLPYFDRELLPIRQRRVTHLFAPLLLDAGISSKRIDYWSILCGNNATPVNSCVNHPVTPAIIIVYVYVRLKKRRSVYSKLFRSRQARRRAAIPLRVCTRLRQLGSKGLFSRRFGEST